MLSPGRPAAGAVSDPGGHRRCHAAAATAEATDWVRIARLYRLLAEITGSPVVELNRAVAVGMADGPAAGLALVARLEAGGALGGYYLLAATRADFLRRLGRNEEAAVAYEEAAALAGRGRSGGS